MICSFWKILKMWNDCTKLESKRGKRDMMSTSFRQEFITVEIYGRRQRPLLYMKYILAILWIQVLTAGKEEVIFPGP